MLSWRPIIFTLASGWMIFEEEQIFLVYFFLILCAIRIFRIISYQPKILRKSNEPLCNISSDFYDIPIYHIIACLNAQLKKNSFVIIRLLITVKKRSTLLAFNPSFYVFKFFPRTVIQIRICLNFITFDLTFLYF